MGGYYKGDRVPSFGGYKGGIQTTEIFNTIESRYYKGVCNQGIDLVIENEDKTSD